MKVVREKLLEWYKINKRDLPWRHTKDPYCIWISEIIFQQTRIDQGLEYYKRFVQCFPNVKMLSEASEEEVLKLWQGLGYYSRARNLHYSAKYIMSELNGKFPNTYDEIIKLKGVGPYTAAAISSICFGIPTPVIDGNVQRFISRLFVISEAVNTSSGQKMISNAIEKIFSKLEPGDFNQAMMEYGATICKPVNPECDYCCFNTECLAFQRGIVSELPNKVKAKAPKSRFLIYKIYKRILEGEAQYLLYKRDNKSIWKGLYEFPYEEFISKKNIQSELNEPKSSYASVCHLEPLKHQLSHQTIFAFPILIDIDDKLPINVTKAEWYSVEQIQELPVSKLIDSILALIL